MHWMEGSQYIGTLSEDGDRRKDVREALKARMTL